MNLNKIHSLVIEEIDQHLLSYNVCESKRFSLENLKANFQKKLVTVDPTLEAAGFAVFSEFNRRGFDFAIDPKCLWHEQLIDHVSFRIEKMLRHLERADDWLLYLGSDADFGEGASVGCDNNYALKQLASQLTFSNPATLVAYKRLCTRDSGFYASEKERQANWGCKRTNYGLCSFVPKDRSKYRMIVSEPSLDMFFQKGLGRYIGKQLICDFGIDITTQEPLNKLLAQIGSATGEFGTIDSTSASDSIYLDSYTNAGIFPAWFSILLNTIKSRFVKYKTKHIKISMVGTQGCGYTFTLMTYILASIVEAVYDMKGIPFKNGVNAGVYGDDVICHHSAYDAVLEGMRLFGFVPNEQKSYNTGPFRESCGGDYYYGYDVRSFYVRKLSTPEHAYVLFNKLFEWCVKNECILFDTLKYIYMHCDRRWRVPPYVNYDGGFHDVQIKGAYRYRMPKHPSIPLPDFHYDGKLQMAVKGYIRDDRLLCRGDTNNTEYYTAKGSCVTFGHPALWNAGVLRQRRDVYTKFNEMIWLYINL